MKKNNYTLAMKELNVLYDQFEQIKKTSKLEETNESFLEKASALKEQVLICKNSLDDEFDYFLNSFESLDQYRENKHKLRYLSVDEQFDVIKCKRYIFEYEPIMDDFNVAGTITKAKIIESKAVLFVLEDLEEVYMDHFMKHNSINFKEKPKKILCYFNFDTSNECYKAGEAWATYFEKGGVHTDFLNSKITLIGQLLDNRIVQVSMFLHDGQKFRW